MTPIAEVFCEGGDEELAHPWDWEPPVRAVEDWEAVAFEEEAGAHFALRPSQFVEQAILMPDPHTRKLEPFDFAERPYLRKIYDTPSKRRLLVCARQVEKSLVETEGILRADGSRVAIKDVQLGDDLVCLATGETLPAQHPGSQMTTSEVTWKSGRYQKPCVTVRTRQGHVARMATTHPVRVWDGWREAGDLRVGDRIAVARHAGQFFNEPQPDARVKLTAYMLGDGSCKRCSLRFTSQSYRMLDDFHAALSSEGMDYTAQRKRGTEAIDLQMPRYKAARLYEWFGADDLLDKTSHTKTVPAWVFRLPKEQTATFLNRLWSTDGHVKQNTGAKWSIEYVSMSRELVLQVQALLWKFGIPSCIRENWPSIYKKRGEKKLAYILRVETQAGVRAFVREIGALDKIERQELPAWPSNSHTDTFPSEVTQLVREIYAAVQPRKGDRTLRSCGIGRLPYDHYCMTHAKLAEYVAFFESDARFDQGKARLLRAHLTADIFWDEIEAVEDIGEQWCYDLTVADHHNFVAGALVTHNSTMLGNLSLTYSCLIPHFKVLYVSPSSTQTKVFSKDRLREPMETSPVLKAWFPGMLTDNVYEKKALNRSQIILRYAFLSADRVRGIPTDAVFIDEFQDILLENISVIEECASHSPFKWFSYSGTPKSLDNPIEFYLSNYSTQNEWAVPCDRHGTPNAPGSWHWNILGEDNIGANSLVCDRCGERIIANHPMAQWVRTGSPDPKFDAFEGFRIPQLMVPWLPWKELLAKYNQYPRAKFYNEVLGRSFDSGQRPLTKQDILDNCNPDISLDPDSVAKVRQRIGSGRIYAGIDWGQDSTNSYTVLCLGTYLDGRFQIFFLHRFTGAESEPGEQLKKIFKIIESFHVARVGVDYGGGFFPNGELLKKYGADKIVRYQYSAPGVYMKYDANLGRYLVHKSEVMSAIFSAIKRKTVFRFPRWNDFSSPFASDCLAVFSEYNERTRMTEYKKSPNTTDDSLHAILFCFLASMVDFPRVDVFIPSAAVDRLSSLD